MLFQSYFAGPIIYIKNQPALTLLLKPFTYKLYFSKGLCREERREGILPTGVGLGCQVWGGRLVVAQLARGRVARSPQMGREEACSSDPAWGW